MKKGDYLPVLPEGVKCSWTTWTEPSTGREILSEEMKVYHFSNNKIKSFAPCVTCFYTHAKAYGHVYEFVFPKETPVTYYGYEEIRVDLDRHPPKSIRYLGTRKLIDKIWIDKRTFKPIVKENLLSK